MKNSYRAFLIEEINKYLDERKTSELEYIVRMLDSEFDRDLMSMSEEDN